MAITVMLEKVEGDGRLWLHSDTELTSDPKTFQTLLPLRTYEARKMKGGAAFSVSVKDHEHINVKGKGRTITPRCDSLTFRLLKKLEAIDGLTAVSISRYVLAIDKARLFAWRTLLPDIKGAVAQVLDPPPNKPFAADYEPHDLPDVEFVGEDEFLIAAGEQEHPTKCSMCGALTPGGPDAFDPGPDADPWPMGPNG